MAEFFDSRGVLCSLSYYVAHILTVCPYNIQGMEGTVDKKSTVLGRDAVFKKTSQLSRLPGYLTVQFVRFSVGKVPGSEEVIARKILKV